MYRIIDGRGTGKTGRLLLLAKENNGIVICQHPEKIRAKAHNYGIVGIDILSYDEYIEFLSGYGNEILVSGRPVFIDEIDEYLRTWDIDIRGYTLSEDA